MNEDWDRALQDEEMMTRLEDEDKKKEKLDRQGGINIGALDIPCDHIIGYYDDRYEMWIATSDDGYPSKSSHFYDDFVRFKYCPDCGEKL